MAKNINKVPRSQKHVLKYYWKEYIAKGTVNILVAEQSTGKSMLALQLCKELLKTKRNDKMLLDSPVIGNPIILYVSTEMNEDLLYARAKEIGITRMKKSNKFNFVCNTSPTLKDIKSEIDETKADFIVIDVMGSVLNAERLDSNSYDDLNRFVSNLKTIGGNKTFLLVHHMNKNKKVMGSIATLSAMDSRLEMLVAERETIDDKMIIYQSMHVYGKSVIDRFVNVKFDYPAFDIVYDAQEDGELDKPLAKLMECVINSAEPIEGTYQQVAAKCKMIDKYQFSPRRMASLLTLNKECLNGNNIYYETKRMSSGHKLKIWYDPGEDDKKVTS